MTVIDTRAGINFAHLLALRGALKLQALGIGFGSNRQSALTTFKRHYNPKCRTAKAAVVEIEAMIQAAREAA